MALAVGAVLVAMAVPSLSGLLARRSVDAAAATIAGELARARQDAIARRRYVGVVFEMSPEGDRFAVYLDGGQTGIRTAEIASGVDELLRGPVDLRSGNDDVRLAIPGPGAIPKVPPSRGVLHAGDDPVQFGGSDIVSFSPTGESSSGAIYLTGRGSELRAVVVFGRSARLRVWSFDPVQHLWRQ
ncbi:MAG TPA: GspH/FimT family pseudopilin [Verrucomicrobiae bacterium]|nr:GspH/FimT family pseudopilin [Verrucomicrobiae bacterium]